MKDMEKYDIGVIIGRFQIHELHVAHKKLIDEVINRHDKVVIFLGVSAAINTRKNPLDFVSRKKMIDEQYGDKISTILPIHDMRKDSLWSKKLDEKIREIFPIGSVILYGSRESFIPYYSGEFKTCELEPESYISATQIRNEIKNKSLRSKEFRAGMIYAANSTFPHVFATVDIAILNEDNTKLLLGRKKDEKKYRFIGGFVDIDDNSFEDCAKREVREETGITIGDLKYICSKKVDDWRYRNEKDRSIITTFYSTKYVSGNPTPNDDIEELKWFEISKIQDNDLVTEHRHLFKKL